MSDIKKSIEMQEPEVACTVGDKNSEISSAIADLSNSFHSFSGLEENLAKQVEVIKSVDSTLKQIAQPDIISQASSYVSIVVSTIGLIVAGLAAVFSWRQYTIAARAEKTQVYYEVLNSLWFFAGYTGEHPESANEFSQKIHRVKSLSSKIFGDEAGNLIQQVLETIHELPTQYASYSDKYGAELSAALEKFGIDPELSKKIATEKYQRNRAWLRKGVFAEFERIFQL